MNYQEVMNAYQAKLASVSSYELYKESANIADFTRKLVQRGMEAGAWDELNEYIVENKERLFEEYKQFVIEAHASGELTAAILHDSLTASGLTMEEIFDIYRSMGGMEICAEWVQWGLDYLESKAH